LVVSAIFRIITERGQKALTAIGLKVEKSQIKPTRGKLEMKDGKEVGIQFIKVALPDILLDSALDLVCNGVTNQYLLSYGIMFANANFQVGF
jgi:hypothetical protein